MIIKIDHALDMPLYLQIRQAIIAAIASGELQPGNNLPSVRSLASDLGINLHTVNKAYAVLRDEGYLVVRGRLGAFVADPPQNTEEPSDAHSARAQRIEQSIRQAALEYMASGGGKEDFLQLAQTQADAIFK